MTTFRLSAFADEADTALAGQLAALEKRGITQMEIRGVNGKNVAELTGDEVRATAASLKDAGVTLSALGSPYGKYPIDAPFDKHREAFRRGLEIAKGLGAERIRMFSFFMPADCRDAGAWQGAVLDRLGEMLRLAKDAGVTLCHENEKGIFGDNDARCKLLLDAFPEMGCVFDPANFVQCGVHPLAAYTLLRGRVTYGHVKDAFFADGAVVPAGAGDGDVAAILRDMAGRGGELTLTLEPHLTVFDGLKGLQSEQVAHRYSWNSRGAAFDAAVDALEGLLGEMGYAPVDGAWVCSK